MINSAVALPFDVTALLITDMGSGSISLSAGATFYPVSHGSGRSWQGATSFSLAAREPMTRRGWIVFGAFVAIDALDFALTVRANLNFRGGPGAVTVMPLSQLLGWITSSAIFLALVGVAVVVVRDRLARARARYRPPQ